VDGDEAHALEVSPRGTQGEVLEVVVVAIASIHDSVGAQDGQDLAAAEVPALNVNDQRLPEDGAVLGEVEAVEVEGATILAAEVGDGVRQRES